MDTSSSTNAIPTSSSSAGVNFHSIGSDSCIGSSDKGLQASEMTVAATTHESMPKQVRKKVDFHASFIAKGKKWVKEILKSPESIIQLQDLLGFQIPRMAPALAFLRTMNINKEAQEKKEREKQLLKIQNVSSEEGGLMYKIHSLLLANLKAELEEKVNSLSETALEKMLDQTVKYIVIPELKSVPMQIIKLIRGSIKENVCRFLAHDRISHVVPELPLPIRRQVWIASHRLFLESIAEDCKACLNQTDKSGADMKAHSTPAKHLADSIGQSDVLFSYFADYCSKLSIEESEEYGSIIQHVLLHMQGNKIKHTLKLRDLAIIIDRVKNNKTIDDNSFEGIISTFKSLMGSQKEGIGNFLDGISQRNLPSVMATRPFLSTMSQPVSVHPLGGSKRPRPNTGKKNKSRTTSKRDSYDSDDGGYASFGDSDEDYDGTDDGPVRKRKAREAKSSARRAAVNKAVYNTINIDEILHQDIHVESPKIDKSDLSENTILDIYEDAIKFIANMDLQGWFALPVTDQIAPNYSNIIDKPMDLSTIRVKVQHYRCFEELSDDIELMLNNCMDYNIEGIYFEGAQFMLEKWQQKKEKSMELIEELGLDFTRTYMPHRDQYITERVESFSKKPRSLLKVSSLSSPSITRPLSVSKLVDDVTSYLQGIDSFSLFLNPVTDDVAPGYSDIVKRPMDISTIRNKKDTYRTTQEICDDVDLMLCNSFLYNRPGDPIYNATTDIQKQWRSKKQSVIDGTFTTKKTPTMARSFPRSSKAKVQRQSTYMAAVLNSNHLEEGSGLLTLLREAWNYMKNIDEHRIFHEPFDTDGYRSIITNPMDLQTMEKKIPYFTSVEDIDQDVRLMLNNCVVFNKGAWGETYANKMLKLWTKKMGEFREKESNFLLHNHYDQYSSTDRNYSSFEPMMHSRLYEENNNLWGLHDENREYMEEEEDFPMQPQPEEPEETEELDESLYAPPAVVSGVQERHSNDDDGNTWTAPEGKTTPPKLVLSFKPKIPTASPHTSTDPVVPTKDSSSHTDITQNPRTTSAAATILKLSLKSKSLARDDRGVKEDGTERNFSENHVKESMTENVEKSGDVYDKSEQVQSQDCKTDATTIEINEGVAQKNEMGSSSNAMNNENTLSIEQEKDVEDLKNLNKQSKEHNYDANSETVLEEHKVTEEEEVHLKEAGATEAHTKLMWGAVMLREKNVQMLLRKFLAKRLETVVTREHKLPSEDEKFRHAYQLYQLSLPLRLNSVGNNVFIDIPGEDELLIRRILPYVLLKFFNAEKNTTASERSKQFYKNVLSESIKDGGFLCEYRQHGTVLGSEDSEKLLLDLLMSWTNFRASLQPRSKPTVSTGSSLHCSGSGGS